MPTIYEKADEFVATVVRKVRDKWHSDLVESQATICLLMATSTNEKPALKLHGTPAAAIARIIPYKQRAAGREDLEIAIDQSFWDDASEAERHSLIDHECYHFVAARDKNKSIKTDDLNRPKFKMRPHDVEHGFFHAIAERHGEASEEVKQAKAFADSYGQLYMFRNADVAIPEGMNMITGEVSE